MIKTLLLLGSSISLLFFTSCRTETEALQNDHFISKQTISEVLQTKNFFSLAMKSNFLNDNAFKKYKDDDHLQIKNIVELKDKNNISAFYVANLIEGGYFLIAADDRSHPIMGLVDNGEFVLSEDELPQAFIGYLDNEIHGIEEVREVEAEQTEEVEAEWNVYRPETNLTFVLVNILLSKVLYSQQIGIKPLDIMNIVQLWAVQTLQATKKPIQVV